MQVFYGSGFPTEKKLKVIKRIIIYVKDEQSLLAMATKSPMHLAPCTYPVAMVTVRTLRTQHILSLHLILFSDSPRA